jgi:dTDP-4-amino-4,6-dideoxygalactose transaminase
VTSSATTALQCAVASIPNLEPGDEILVADFSFPASANAVAWLGCKPILVDSEEFGLGLDIDTAENLVSERTRAVIAVDPFGLSPDFRKIRSFCDKYSLIFIEDAACALGSRIDDQYLGTFGDIGCFSFHPRKLVNSGEGGALVSKTRAIDSLLRKLVSHGSEMTNLFPDFTIIGTNARLSEFASSLGLRQLYDLNSEIQGRHEVCSWYLEELGGLSQVTFPHLSSGTVWNYQTLTLQTKSQLVRNSVISALRSKGIASTLGTYAIHSQIAYLKYGYKPGDLPNSFRFQNTLFSVPMYSQLSRKNVKYISQIVRENMN